MNRNYVLLLSSITMLLAITVVILTFIENVNEHAHAATPYIGATVQLAKTYDGTGHGTVQQTFINANNGFKTGDNSPTDGIVASGDEVGYKFRVDLKAGPKRTVNLSFAQPSNGYLTRLTDPSAFCVGGGRVKATSTGDGCSYEIPAGAVWTGEQTIVFKAGDTAGKIVRDQTVHASLSIGSTSVDAVSDGVTIVSAPLADLILSDYDSSGQERTNDWYYQTCTQDKDYKWSCKSNENNGGSGSFDVIVRKLTYPKYSTSKGITTDLPWKAKLDVTDFPKDTIWSSKGTNLVVYEENSRRYVDLSGIGNIAVNYSLPKYDDSSVKDPTELGSSMTQLSYDARLIVDKTSFSNTSDGIPVLNNGNGSQPGDGQDKNYSTEDASIGSRAGFPYLNNDWSRAIVRIRSYQIPYVAPPSGGGSTGGGSTGVIPTPPSHGPIFSKTIYRPQRRQLVFDDASKQFADPNDATDVRVDHYSTSSYFRNDFVASGTQVNTLLSARMQWANTGDMTMSDSWDIRELQLDPSMPIKVNIPASNYVLKWSKSMTKTVDVNDESVDWHVVDEDHPIDYSKAQSIRIDFKNLPYGKDKGAMVTVSIMSIASGRPADKYKNDEWKQDDSACASTMICADDSATFKIADTADAHGSDYVVIIPDYEKDTGLPNDAYVRPSITANPTVAVYDPDGKRRPNDDSQAGDKVRYTIDTSIDGIGRSNYNLSPVKITVLIDKDVLYLKNDSSWNMEVKGVDPKTSKNIVEFTYENDVPTDSNGKKTYQPIYFSGTVSNIADGSILMSTTPSAPEIKDGASRTTSFTVSTPESTYGYMEAVTPKVEINGELTWRFNLFSNESSSSVNAMLRLPSNSDEIIEKTMEGYGIEGAWTRGHSAFNGSLSLKSVDIDADNSSSDVKILYGHVPTGKADPMSLDPKDYTWDDDKTNAVAIRLDGVGAENSINAVSGTVTLTANSNKVNDKYLMWLSKIIAKTATGDIASTVPWGADERTVDSSISGTVWWDSNNDSFLGDDEDRIEDTTVTLNKIDEKGNEIYDDVFKKPLTTKTDANGRYKFDGLNSGRYKTDVTRDSAVPLTTTTYFRQKRAIVNTYTYPDLRFSDASNDSGAIALGVDTDLIDVDFGFYKSDPKATLDKKQMMVDCPDSSTDCTVNWDVAIENKGEKTTSKNISIEDYSVATPPYETTSYPFVLMIDEAGHLWAQGWNDYGQLGLGDMQERSRLTRLPVDIVFTKVFASETSAAAIDIDGNIWEWGKINGAKSPMKINVDNKPFFSKIALSDTATWAITTSGELYGWGSSTTSIVNGKRQVGRPELDSRYRVKDIAYKSSRIYILSTDGSIRKGGNDGFDTVDSVHRFESIAVTGLDNEYRPVGVTKNGEAYILDSMDDDKILDTKSINNVYIGGSTYIIHDDGTASSYGGNGNGQLCQPGNYSTNPVYSPKEMILGFDLKAVAPGQSHAYLIDANDNVYQCGYSKYNSSLSDDFKIKQVMKPDGTAFKAYSPRIPSQPDADSTDSIPAGAVLTDVASNDIKMEDPVTVNTVDGSNKIDFKQIKIYDEPTVPAGSAQSQVAAAETTRDSKTGYTTRTYATPFAVRPGGRIVFHFKGTVSKAKAARLLVNQAWLTSDNTPYSSEDHVTGVPNALNSHAQKPRTPDDGKNADGSPSTTPGVMSADDPRYVPSTDDFIGNTTCRTGSDYPDGDEHSFNNDREDLCDQVGLLVPALPDGTAEPVKGSISGVYWLDSNKDGIRQTNEECNVIETSRAAQFKTVSDTGYNDSNAGRCLKNIQVTLFDSHGEYVDSQTTDENGEYKFTDLPLGEYYVWFGSKPDNILYSYEFTKPSIGGTDANEAADSDASTQEDSYGKQVYTADLTEQHPNETNVDAGIIAVRKNQDFLTMPMTGGYLLLAMIALVLITVSLSYAKYRELRNGERRYESKN